MQPGLVLLQSVRELYVFLRIGDEDVGRWLGSPRAPRL
jgi:hypothetical protein